MGGLHKLPSSDIPGPRELISGGLQVEQRTLPLTMNRAYFTIDTCTLVC